MKYQVLNPASADAQGNARPLVIATIPHPERKEFPEGMQVKALDKEGTFDLGAFEAHYLKEHGMIVNRLDVEAKLGTKFAPAEFEIIGYQAFKNGRKRTECPYNPKTEAEQKAAWISGWDEGYKEREEQNAAFNRGAQDFKKHVKAEANPFPVDPEEKNEETVARQKALAAQWTEGWEKAKDQAG